MTRYTKAWELFPGKNKFYCNGRILTTKGQFFSFQRKALEDFLLDNKILFVSLGLITLTYGLFIAFDCRLTLIDNYKFGILIPIICTVLYVFVLAMLFRTSFSDPGVVPRKLDDFIHWLIIVPCAQLCTLQLEIIDRILGTEGLEKTRCPLYQYFIIQSKKEPHNTKQKRLRDKRWMKKELKQATRGTVRLLESVKSKYPE